MFADIGTGSGCIAIAVLAHCPHVSALAIDLSDCALETARRNARRLGVADRLRIVRGNLMRGVGERRLDLIVSNPPYVETAALELLQPEVRDAEPRLALDGGPDGLAPYRRLAPQAMRSLRQNGWLAVEVGAEQAPDVMNILRVSRFEAVSTVKDLAGIERIVVGRTR